LRLLKQFVGGYLIGVALAVVVFLFATYAHCAVSKKHNNSIGTVMYMDNPMTYKAGAITSVAYIGHEGISVRMQPIGTYGLFTEEFLFCGLDIEKFMNQTNPMVLTFRTKASRMIDGIGCHELINVSSIKPKERSQ
jgi:hypothetical protein